LNEYLFSGEGDPNINKKQISYRNVLKAMIDVLESDGGGCWRFSYGGQRMLLLRK
jgi:hypothetical protein